MLVLSNQRLGPAAELLVSREVAEAMLRTIAAAVRDHAQARWEHELARWLDARSRDPGSVLDVDEIAWTPEHFEHQRRFVLDAIARAADGSEHGPALARWARLIEAHPRDSVQFGRRWAWQPSA